MGNMPCRQADIFETDVLLRSRKNIDGARHSSGQLEVRTPMNYRTLAFASLLSFIVLSPSVCLAAVIYSEPINGDLPADPNAAPILPLLPGDNDVEGEIVPPGDNEDFFKFIIPENFTAPSLRFGLPPSQGPVAPVEVELGSFPTPDFFDVFIEITISTTAPPIDLLDQPTVGPGPPLDNLSGGLYGMRMKALDDPMYVITIELAPVPEPSTLVLALLSLIGLFACGHRRRRG